MINTISLSLSLSLSTVSVFLDAVVAEVYDYYVSVGGGGQSRRTLQLVRVGIDGEKVLARLKMEYVNHRHFLFRVSGQKKPFLVAAHAAESAFRSGSCR